MFFLYFPTSPLISSKLSQNVSCCCGSCWHSYTEQLTASLMTKWTKPPPANSTEPSPQFPIYYICCSFFGSNSAHVSLYLRVIPYTNNQPHIPHDPHISQPPAVLYHCLPQSCALELQSSSLDRIPSTALPTFTAFLFWSCDNFSISL
jgi:hypothetical protein